MKQATSPLANIGLLSVVILMEGISLIPLLPQNFGQPVLADMAATLDVPLDRFQLILPLFAVIQVLAMPAIALKSDQGYRLHCLYLGISLFFVGTCCVLSTNTPYGFCIGWILIACTSATLLVVIPALISETYDDCRLGQALSYVTAMGFVVLLIGPEISVYTSDHWHWKATYIGFLVYPQYALLDASG